MQERPRRWGSLIIAIKGQLSLEAFWGKHRRGDEDFTRERVLTFPVVVLLLLQKTTRSIQRHAHCFLRQLWPGQDGVTVTPGGWTQARAKLRHTAFIELNQDFLLPELYSTEQAQHCQRWRGFRVLGVDSSTLRLPSHEEVSKEFGVSHRVSQSGTVIEYNIARLSVLYDLLNDVGLDAQMAPQTIGELDMVAGQLKHVNPGDVLVWDRGFTGFVLLAQVHDRGAHFIGRCSERSFLAAQQMFRRNRAGCSQVVKIFAAPAQKPKAQALNLPVEMIVRFVSVRLPNGQLEVLVTSLLDERVYPTEEFLEVYHWRWNHETYHQMLKSRLDLENWTGQTLEAVRQDLQAAVLVSNLESLLSQEVQEELAQGDAERQNPLQVNRAVAYHALKEKLLDLLYHQKPVDVAIREIQAWMRCNPVSIRKRKIPRRPSSPQRSYHYQRNTKKSVF